MGIPTLRPCRFESSEDIMTRFKSQALHVIRIKPGGSGSPPSLIPALWNVAISLHKQATHSKHFEDECNNCLTNFYPPTNSLKRVYGELHPSHSKESVADIEVQLMHHTHSNEEAKSIRNQN